MPVLAPIFDTLFGLTINFAPAKRHPQARERSLRGRTARSRYRRIDSTLGRHPTAGSPHRRLADAGASQALSAFSGWPPTPKDSATGPSWPPSWAARCAAEEVARLEFRHVALREARWVIVDLVGKGRRVRSVPVPAWVKAFLDRWTVAAQITEGRLFRALNKAGKIAGESLSDDAVWLVVRKYAAALGQKQWGPHDLRRTCAKLCAGPREERSNMIQLLLGHASIATTERYLGTR